jgi:muconate cycloisomerase
MRIESVAAAVRPLRLREHQVMGKGELAGQTENVFVRVRSSDGVAGYGEAATWPLFCAETPAGIRQLVLDGFAPLLRGRPVLDLNANSNLIADAILGNPAAKSATEMALVDLAARTLQVPAAALFGGQVRHSLGLSYSVSAQDAAAETDLVRERYEQGYRIFKLKTGVLGWRADVARLEALLRTADDIQVRLDFNGTGSPFEMARFLKAVDGYPIDFVEQPFAPADVQALRWLRERSGFALCADESCRGMSDLQQIVRGGWYDVVSLKVGKLGGLRRTEMIGKVAAAWGLRCYAGAFSETRLATSAALHVMLTLDNLVDGCDYYFSLVTLAEGEPHGGFHRTGGNIALSAEPGFGVAVPDGWFS